MSHFTKFLLCFFISTSLFAQSQKRPLNALDYDRWQSVKSEKISNDGRWIAYQIDPQEGDGRLEVTAGLPGSAPSPKYMFPRGYMAQFTPDSKFLVMRLKVPLADTHKAKIKKKKADDLPKDSLLVLDMATGKAVKMPNVKSVAVGKDAGAWLAILQQPKDEKEKPAAKVAAGSGKDTLNPIAPVSTTTVATKKGRQKKQKATILRC